MLDAKGNYNRTLLHSVITDEGYLQVAAHIEHNLCEKILRFEYVDFSKFLPHDRLIQQDDHRLAFINKDGVPYLVPAGDTSKDTQISGYVGWDQAFRVYSEIITSKYPGKA